VILKGTPATISAQWFDADTAADPGAVTVTILRADGTTLVASTAASGTGTNARTFELDETTDTAQVDVLTATWVSATHGTVVTYHPVVGGFYVDLKTLRDSGDLAEETRFPDQALADVRRWWMDLVDDYCRQSFVPMYRIETQHRRSGRDVLLLDRPRPRIILSAALNGAAIDTSTWILTRSGEIITAEGIPPLVDPGRLTIAYEHGHDRPDAELYDAGITAMRDHLLSSRSGRASRQTLITNTLGTVRLAQPGDKRATGIPEVDAVLNRRIGDISF
jgi:hypothetical protein